MKLYVGGIYQGQLELAWAENPGAEIIENFHERLRGVVADRTDAREYARDFIEKHPNAVVVSDEVGMGVVPIDKGDRAFREAVGRAVCLIAQHSESVTRVTCGIGMRIK